MRCFVVALILSLCSALPIAAHADTFNYTLTVDYPSNLFSDIDASIFDGTFSFSEPSLLTGLTSIYPPAFTEPNGSPVDLIQLGLFPSQNYYYFDLYAANDGPEIGSNLLPLGTTGNFKDPYVTLDVTDVANSPVPEPSTFALLATGILGTIEVFRGRARGRTAHT
jgi:PEP-CTERM motif